MTSEATAPAEQVSPEEAELQARFEPDRIGQLAEEFLESGTPHNLREMAGDRQFVVAYIPADSRFADIPRSVETTVFAEAFQQSLGQVVSDYGKYDPVSTYAAVIDISTPVPRAAGALRICEHDPEIGFKDVNDLLTDDPENPWLEEVKANYFAPDEEYDAATAWRRMGERNNGEELSLDDSLDIATHASARDYRGEHGGLNGVSMLFYHACLRYTMATHRKNLLAIFDLPPFANLQQFGEPFEAYEALEPHPYGGPYETIPAYCVIDRGMQRIRDADEEVGRVFIDGKNLDNIALLPSEYESEQYSDHAVGL